MCSRRRAAIEILTGNSINTLIVSIQAILLIPLYLDTIGPRLYGAWLGSGDILAWMYAFDLGLPNLMIQRIGAAHGRGDFSFAVEYLMSGLLALLLLGLAVILVAFGISFYLPDWMGLFGAEAKTLQKCFVIGSAATALNMLNYGAISFSRGIQKTLFMNAVMVASSLTGFCVSVALALAGYGLWAIAIGLAVRSIVSLMGGIIFLANSLRGNFCSFFLIRFAILREFLFLSPATTLGGISYTAMNQSEAALVAIFLKPEFAVVYTITRKGLDLVRSLVDSIAFATYGGFSHLVSSDQQDQALDVYTEINSLRLSLAIVMASAYMAVNPSLVEVWAGKAQYGGPLLSVLMAINFIVVGNSFLVNYLFRATGHVLKGSMALFFESLLRVPLMIGFLILFGLPGVPLAGIITGGLFWLLAHQWTLDEILLSRSAPPKASILVWFIRVSAFGLGALLCAFIQENSWAFVLLTGSTVAVVGTIGFVIVDSSLKCTLASFIEIMDARFLGSTKSKILFPLLRRAGQKRDKILK